MTVTLYSSKTCAPCHTVKHYLRNHKIKFEEKQVDEVAAWRKEAFDLAQMIIYPVIKVDDTVILGRDLGALNKALKLN